MLLTATNVVSFLSNAGLLDPQSVVDGHLLVEETHRRNRNFKISRSDGPGYFVKQVARWEPENFATLYAESECYRQAHEDGPGRGLSPLLPRYVHYDQARSILVTGLLSNACSFSEHRSRGHNISTEAASKLGDIFGQYHRLSADPNHPSPLADRLERRTPWILQLHRVDPRSEAANQHSGGNRQMIAILQRFPDFTAQLDRLHSEWQYRCLVHGDVKWDNCMLLEEDGQPAAKIIDWELANWGDPAWDVGCIFGAFLAGWIQSLPAKATEQPGAFDRVSENCLAEMQPPLHAFWMHYCDSLQLSFPERRSYLNRCLRFSAGRLLQTAYEYLQFVNTVDANTYLLLQVSQNILSQPEEAVEDLLGL